MTKPIAIVLAGSGDNRIAETHYGMPQELYTANMLSAMGLETYITQRSESVLDCHYGVLSELYSDRGAIEAIIALLDSKETEIAMLVPCDMPLIDSNLLQLLIDGYQEEDTIVCFRQHGTPYIEPFPAIFEKGVLELLVTDVVAGKITLQELLSHTGSDLIEIPVDDRLLNVSDEDARSKINQILSTM